MKKYLFGLGAMLVGAGLMFVLMHGEVSADDVSQFKCTGEGVNMGNPSEYQASRDAMATQSPEQVSTSPSDADGPWDKSMGMRHPARPCMVKGPGRDGTGLGPRGCGRDMRSPEEIASDPYDTNNPASQAARANTADGPTPKTNAMLHAKCWDGPCVRSLGLRHPDRPCMKNGLSDPRKQCKPDTRSPAQIASDPCDTKQPLGVGKHTATNDALCAALAELNRKKEEAYVALKNAGNATQCSGSNCSIEGQICPRGVPGASDASFKCTNSKWVKVPPPSNPQFELMMENAKRQKAHDAACRVCCDCGFANPDPCVNRCPVKKAACEEGKYRGKGTFMELGEEVCQNGQWKQVGGSIECTTLGINCR